MCKQQQNNYSKVMQWLLDNSSKSDWQKFMEEQTRDYLMEDDCNYSGGIFIQRETEKEHN